MSENCIFCKIIRGEIPSTKLIESTNILSFMDINPLSDGHCLFIPKIHAEKMHEIDDETLAELLMAVKKIAKAGGFDHYNILQNNGRLSGQEVMHAHFHLIPKTETTGLGLKIGAKGTRDVGEMAKMIIANIKHEGDPSCQVCFYRPNKGESKEFISCEKGHMLCKKHLEQEITDKILSETDCPLCNH